MTGRPCQGRCDFADSPASYSVYSFCRRQASLPKHNEKKYGPLLSRKTVCYDGKKILCYPQAFHTDGMKEYIHTGTNLLPDGRHATFSRKYSMIKGLSKPFIDYLSFV
jgi:hypothetical protein